MHTPLRCLSHALVLVPLLLGGCQSGSGDATGLVSEGFPAPDKALVYEAAMDALRQQGFTPDSSASSETQGVIVSRYKLVLAPFSGQGYRDKATIRIADVVGRPSYYTVEANVLREPNMNLTEPSNPIAAEWGGPTRVNEHENILRTRVEMRFSAPGASPAFRKSRGLAPAAPARDFDQGTGPAPNFKR